MDMEKLKGKISEEGMTKDELAFRMGISVKALNAKLNYRTRITVCEAEKMRKILKIENPSVIFFNHQSQMCDSKEG